MPYRTPSCSTYRLAKVFGYPTTAEAQDSALSPRGYRAMAEIPRLQFAHVDLLVRSFGTLQGVLAASSNDLQSVDGIGAMWARHVREGLSQLAESTITDSLVREFGHPVGDRDREQPPAVPQAVAPSPVDPAPGQAGPVAGSG